MVGIKHQMMGHVSIHPTLVEREHMARMPKHLCNVFCLVGRDGDKVERVSKSTDNSQVHQ